MSNQNIFSALIAAWVVVPSLALLAGAGSARAQSNPSNYTYEMSGAGTFNTQSKSVTAAGTFAHKSSDGTVLEAGVWIVSQLVSFDSYGIAPGALLSGGRVFSLPKFGPKGLPIFSGSMPTGGLAVFRIRFLPRSGASKTAVLRANCALGDVPPERSVEGIRLTFEGNGGEFSEEVSGRVMFLSIRPEANTPAKTPQHEPAPDSVEPPSS